MQEARTPLDQHRRFEALVLPHLDAAYNLARWFTHNDEDAHDVVQEAYLRALRYFESFRGEKVLPWLLQIVRHTSYSWLVKNRPKDMVSLDDCDDAWREIAGPGSEEPRLSWSYPQDAMRNAADAPNARASLNRRIDTTDKSAMGPLRCRPCELENPR